MVIMYSRRHRIERGGAEKKIAKEGRQKQGNDDNTSHIECRDTAEEIDPGDRMSERSIAAEARTIFLLQWGTPEAAGMLPLMWPILTLLLEQRYA